MDFSSEAAIIEAILFLEVAPVKEKELSAISKLGVQVVSKAIEHLVNRYSQKEYGIELVENADGWGFLPKPYLWLILKEHYGKKNSGNLTKTAMETLSIIAYSQPVTRSEIESIRGVSCESVIRILKEKDLVRSVGKKDTPGRPALYGTTAQFLKLFELKSIAELPGLNEKDKRKFDGE